MRLAMQGADEPRPASPIDFACAKCRDLQEQLNAVQLVAPYGRRILRLVVSLWPDGSNIAREHLLTAVDRWLRAEPHRVVGRDAMAAYQARHFVAFEAAGLGAFKAEIHKPVPGGEDWNGDAGSCRRPVYHRPPQPYTAKDVLAEAVSTFAGPPTQYNDLCKTIQVVLLSKKYSEMAGCKYEQAIALVLAMTDDILDSNARIIMKEMKILKDHEYIYNMGTDVDPLLRGVQPSNLTIHSWEAQPDQVKGVGRLLAKAPADMVAALRGFGI